MAYEEDLRTEQRAVAEVKRLATEMAEHTKTLWHWGDGHGGAILEMIASAAGIDYFAERTTGPSSTKAAIPRLLAKAVFERDAYRCVTCGDHIDLTCDHILAESRGGPTELENLQTMCRPCNSRKGSR